MKTPYTPREGSMPARLIAHLREHGGSMGRKQIAELLGIPPNNVPADLAAAVHNGALVRDGGIYRLPIGTATQPVADLQEAWGGGARPAFPEAPPRAGDPAPKAPRKMRALKQVSEEYHRKAKQPGAALAAVPKAAPVAQRNSRAMLDTARAALLQREYGITELAEHIEAQHPDRTLNMVNLVERLVQLGEIELVDDKLGLTEAGEDAARRLGAHRVGNGRPKQPPGEAERRALLLAGNGSADLFALTRGQRRAVASAADLATPPMRPGAQACLELPSRIGNHLHYRSGRITTMDGTEVQPARGSTAYRPTREGRSAAERLAFPDKLFAR